MASDFGTFAQLFPEGQQVIIPFLLEAKNLYYSLDNGAEKIRGATLIGARLDTSGIDSVHHYWYETAGTVFNRRIAQVGTDLYVDTNGDESFSTISTGFAPGSKLFYTQFDNDLIISSTSDSDVPQVYNGSTITDLGNPANNTPNFEFAAVHKNRLWAAGVSTAPNTLYYSETLPNGPGGDWAGANAGTIQIDPGDGDEIRGLVSYKDNLFVFKGPNKGSIHRIEGTSPTGIDPFARRDFLQQGLPVDSPNGFFLFNDDIGFVTADGGVHSLKATASFGEFNEVSLTRGIQTFIRENVNLAQMGKVDAALWDERGIVLFCFPFGVSTTPDTIMAMDIRFSPPRWSVWDEYVARSLTDTKDTEDLNKNTVMIGGSDGALRRIDQGGYRVEDPGGGTYTSIEAKIQTPSISYGLAQQRFNLATVSLALRPDGISTGLVAWRRDNNPSQSVTFAAQGNSDTLGETFLLGTSTLGFDDVRYRHSRMGEMGGEFSQIQYTLSNDSLTSGNVGHGFELRGFEVELMIAGDSLEND